MLKKNTKLIGLLWALACTAFLSRAIFAQDAPHAVEGAYDITATGEQVGTVKFLMVLKRANGKWAGEIKDAPVQVNIESVSVDADNNVVIKAAADGNPLTINGKYSDGKITGKWAVGDGTGEWTGVKQASAAAASGGAAPAASASASAVEGTYDAQIIADGQGTLSFTLVVKRSGDKLATEVRDGGDINIVGITLNGEAVTLDATYQGNPFSLPGKRAGQDMGGKWEAGGFTGTWAAKKRGN